MKWYVGLATIFGVLVIVGWTEIQQAPYLRLSRAIELFGMVVREINDQYVEPVETEQLVDDAIAHLLSRLDPYTEFYREEQSADLDFLLQGRYVGVGIRLGTVDSTLVVIGITPGTSAERAGVRLGDVLLRIDSIEVAAKDVSEVRRYLRGPLGSNVKLLLKRVQDTFSVKLRREDIVVRNVTYAGIVQPGIAVIRLERFSRRAPEEMRVALDSLRGISALRGLILDLRDNPGGLLDAAVNIAEMFLRQGDTIVMTKSRGGTNQRVYVARAMPYVDTTLPIVVIVNSRSASASEILAGALQDNDRAVIVGDTTLGKGLVQTVISLPYNAALKLTTARYYTPSGRSIQHMRQWCPQCIVHHGLDSERVRTFTTVRYRRPLRSGIGIVPDTVLKNVEIDSIPAAIGRPMVWKFATHVASRYQAFPETLSRSALIAEFLDYMGNEHSDTTNLLTKLHKLVIQASRDGWTARAIQQIERTIQTLRSEQQHLAAKQSQILGAVLEQEVRNRFLNDHQIVASTVPNDPVIRAAADFVRSAQYRKFFLSAHAGER